MYGWFDLNHISWAGSNLDSYEVLLSRMQSIIWAASWENGNIAYAKTKAQISFAVTAKLISAFVFATRIVQFLFYLNPKFQAISSFLGLYRPVCVGPGRKPRRPVFLRRGSYGNDITYGTLSSHVNNWWVLVVRSEHLVAESGAMSAE